MTRALRVGSAVLPPLLVFCAVRWLMATAAATVGFDAWKAESWVRWDAGHYMAIATTGYEYFSCARIGGRWSDACGNAAWFPLYPWVMRPFIALDLDRNRIEIDTVLHSQEGHLIAQRSTI